MSELFWYEQPIIDKVKSVPALCLDLDNSVWYESEDPVNNDITLFVDDWVEDKECLDSSETYYSCHRAI